MSNQTILETPASPVHRDKEKTAVDVNPVTTPEQKEDDSVKQSKVSSLIELFRKYASLSDLLRYGGAMSVAVAMALFLVEGARGFTDMERFLTMLGFTGALTAAGFLMSMLVKEQRGSRVFIGLSLLSVPVNFTVFGALIYSFIPLDGVAANYPGFAEWQVAGLADIALAAVAGLAALMPVVWAGYTVLARPERHWLSAALIVSGTALLIPVRHEIIVAVTAILAASSSWWFLSRFGRDSLALKTMEGKFARLLLFVSPVIVIARSVFLYEATGVLMLILSGGIYMGARYLLISRKEANWFTLVTTLVAFVLTYGIGASLFEIGNNLIREEYAMLFACCAFLLVTCDLLKVSPNAGFATTASMFNVILTTCLMVGLALYAGGTILVFCCIAVLAATAIAAFLQRYPVVSIISSVGIAAIAVTYVETMWSLAIDTGWWGIAGLGVVAIVAGSLVDRAGTVVKGVV